MTVIMPEYVYDTDAGFRKVSRAAKFLNIAAIAAVTGLLLFAGCTDNDDNDNKDGSEPNTLQPPPPPPPPCNTAPPSPDFRWFTDNPEAASFTIKTARELAGLAEIVNGDWKGEPWAYDFDGKTVTLASDIDLSEYCNWVPIGFYGRKDDERPGFFGTFDGGGHVISNLTAYYPNEDHVGLFGFADSIRNLGLENANVFGHQWVGGIVGETGYEVDVVNCYSTGSVRGRNYVGGVAGTAAGMAKCYSGATVISVASPESRSCLAGGVVGKVGDGGLTDCYFTGTVLGFGGSETGGLAGKASGGILRDSYSTGTVTSTGYRVGGVVGSTSSVIVLINCYSTGAVTGEYDVGGVAGYLYGSGGTIGCYSTGAVTATGPTDIRQMNKVGYAGGVAGFIHNGSKVANCYSTSTVIGVNILAVGGIVGGTAQTSAADTIVNCAALNPEIKGNNFTGRVVGQINTTSFWTDSTSNNAAYAGMKNSAGNTEWTNKGAGANDGEDITAAAITADGAIGGRFTSSDGWTTQNGKLPGFLGKMVDMPGHLR